MAKSFIYFGLLFVLLFTFSVSAQNGETISEQEASLQELAKAWGMTRSELDAAILLYTSRPTNSSKRALSNCNQAQGAKHGDACDDGNPCTYTDICSADRSTDPGAFICRGYNFDNPVTPVPNNIDKPCPYDTTQPHHYGSDPCKKGKCDGPTNNYGTTSTTCQAVSDQSPGQPTACNTSPSTCENAQICDYTTTSGCTAQTYKPESQTCGSANFCQLQGHCSGTSSTCVIDADPAKAGQDCSNPTGEPANNCIDLNTGTCTSGQCVRNKDIDCEETEATTCMTATYCTEQHTCRAGEPQAPGENCVASGTNTNPEGSCYSTEDNEGVCSEQGTCVHERPLPEDADCKNPTVDFEGNDQAFGECYSSEDGKCDGAGVCKASVFNAGDACEDATNVDPYGTNDCYEPTEKKCDSATKECRYIDEGTPLPNGEDCDAGNTNLCKTDGKCNGGVCEFTINECPDTECATGRTCVESTGDCTDGTFKGDDEPCTPSSQAPEENECLYGASEDQPGLCNGAGSCEWGRPKDTETTCTFTGIPTNECYSETEGHCDGDGTCTSDFLDEQPCNNPTDSDPFGSVEHQECYGTTASFCSTDGNECKYGSTATYNNDAGCNDGNECTENDICNQGGCAGTNIAESDRATCSSPSDEPPSEGNCLKTDTSSGICNGDGVCIYGQYAQAETDCFNPTVASDGISAIGECYSTAEGHCNDEGICLADVELGEEHDCGEDEPNKCKINGRCDGNGSCYFDDVVCDDTDCSTERTCDESTGTCGGGTHKDDTVPCTPDASTNSEAPVNACLYGVSDDKPGLCNGAGSCEWGRPKGTETTCTFTGTPTNECYSETEGHCDGDGTCTSDFLDEQPCNNPTDSDPFGSEEHQECYGTTDSYCSTDGNECKYGSTANYNNDADCNDGNECTENDTCNQGGCAGTNIADSERATCSTPTTSDEIPAEGGCIKSGPTEGLCSEGSCIYGQYKNEGDDCTIPTQTSDGSSMDTLGPCWDTGAGHCDDEGRCIGDVKYEPATPCVDADLCKINGECDVSGECISEDKTCPETDCSEEGTCFEGVCTPGADIEADCVPEQGTTDSFTGMCYFHDGDSEKPGQCSSGSCTWGKTRAKGFLCDGNGNERPIRNRCPTATSTEIEELKAFQTSAGGSQVFCNQHPCVADDNPFTDYDNEGFCDCYSTYGGNQCDESHATGEDLPPVDNVNGNFSPDASGITLTQEAVTLSVVLPSSQNPLNKDEDTHSVQTLTRLKFSNPVDQPVKRGLSPSYGLVYVQDSKRQQEDINPHACNYPNDYTWELTSEDADPSLIATQWQDTFTNSFGYTELFNCGLAYAGADANFAYFNTSLLIQREFTLSNGRFSFNRVFAVDQIVSLEFPRKLSIQSSVIVSNNTVEFYAAVTGLTFNPTQQLWTITISTAINKPYYHLVLPQNPSNPHPSSPIRDFYRDKSDATCTSSPTEHCQQTWTFLTHSCAALQIEALELNFQVECISGGTPNDPTGLLGECASPNPDPEPVDAIFKITTASACPVTEEFKITDAELKSYSDDSFESERKLFGISEDMFLKIDFTEPPAKLAAEEGIIIVNVCAHPTVEIEEDEIPTLCPEDRLVERQLVYLNTPDEYLDTSSLKKQLGFHVNSGLLKAAAGVNDDENHITVQVDISIQYSGEIAGNKRKVQSKTSYSVTHEIDIKGHLKQQEMEVENKYNHSSASATTYGLVVLVLAIAALF